MEKREASLDNKAPKAAAYHSSEQRIFCANSEAQNVKAADRFHHSLLKQPKIIQMGEKLSEKFNWSQTKYNFTKLNKNWKFNPRILLKDNFTENSNKSNESWNFSMKPQKLLKFKELCFPDSHSQICPANYAKICNALTSLSFLPFFHLYKICF